MTEVRAEAIRNAMLQAAHQRAELLLARARQQGYQVLEDAGAQVARLIAAGRREGAVAAEAAIAPQRRAAHRAAREMLLRAQAEVGTLVAAESRAAALDFREDPDYPRLLDALEQSARARLGPGVLIERDPSGCGGVRAHLDNLSLDYSLTALADHAVAQVGMMVAAARSAPDEG